MKKTLNELRGHIMTGISWAIPMIIGAGMMVGIPSIIGLFFNVTSWGDFEANTVWYYLKMVRDVGWVGIGLFNVVLAGFVAYSIGDKAAIGAGFIAGQFANNRGTGFIGAVLLAFAAGYIARYLKNNLKFKNEQIEQIKGVVFIPLLTVATVAIIGIIIDRPLIAINTSLIDWIKGMSESNTSSFILAMVIGAMIASDLGGPINKAAFTAITALVADGVFTPAVYMRVAICSIPLGYALAVFFNRDKFSKELQGQGVGAFVMSLVGITEGAIPFVLISPLKLTILNIIAGAIGSGLSAVFKASTDIPMFGGVYGALAVTNNPLGYLIGVFVSAGIIAIVAPRLVSFNEDSVEDEDVEIELSFE